MFMKKIFTLSTLKLMVLSVFATLSTTAMADDIGAYVLKAATKAYPSGAGLVYGSFTKTAPEKVPADKWAEYSEETTTSILSETGFYVAGKPNDGWHWTGVAGTMKDAEGNLVPAADSLGNIKFHFYTNPYIDVATHGEYYDSDAEALANAPEQPDSVVLTLFGRVIPSYGKHQALLGKVGLDNPVNDIGQEVTLTAYPDTCGTFAYWTKNDPENGEKITDNPLKITVTESAIYYAHFENPEAIKFKGDEGYIFWYDESTWKMPGYEDDEDNSIVAYAFSNGNFVDEKAGTGARATYYKKWTDDNYTIMGGYPHILKINGPGLIYSLYNTPSELLTKAYNMTRWTGKDGLDTDFVDCPDGTENYFYLADLESMSWKLCKDYVLPAEKMCLIVNSASCSKDFQGAPEVIYWSQQAAEAVGITKVELEKAQNSKVYTLDGMPVNEVRKGIYVIGGKKVLK